MIGLLDQLAAKHHVFLSDLRLIPALRRESLGDLSAIPDKERYPLQEWEDAVSYLSGCDVRFESYEQVENLLEQSSRKVRGEA